MKIPTVVFLLIFLFCSSLFAQEKVIANITVELGVISWSDIEKGFKENPRTPTDEYYLKMTKKTAQTHGEYIEGSYHILVVLIDKTSGQQIKERESLSTLRPRSKRPLKKCRLTEVITSKLQKVC